MTGDTPDSLPPPSRRLPALAAAAVGPPGPPRHPAGRAGQAAALRASSGWGAHAGAPPAPDGARAAPARPDSPSAPPTPPPAQAKREKMAFFERHVTPVAPGLFVGGDAVARDRVKLAGAGVTHVLNAAAYTSPEYFRRLPRTGAAADGGPPLAYRSLWLADTGSEEIVCVLYPAFDFIELARQAGGACLVHCTHGVSRSVAICVGYVMWKNGLSYDDAFAAVRSHRQVASPNMSFMVQLLQWAKRRAAGAAGGTRVSSSDASLGVGVRLYRMAPHSAADPRTLVPRPVTHRPVGPQLDARAAFVLACPCPAAAGGGAASAGAALFIWLGGEAAPGFGDAARAFARQLGTYEGYGCGGGGAGAAAAPPPPPPLLVLPGQEPAALLAAVELGPAEAAAMMRHQRNPGYDERRARAAAPRSVCVPSAVGGRTQNTRRRCPYALKRRR